MVSKIIYNIISSKIINKTDTYIDFAVSACVASFKWPRTKEPRDAEIKQTSLNEISRAECINIPKNVIDNRLIICF